MTSSKRFDLWKNVSESDWKSWEWQVRNRITTLDGLKQFFHLSKEEEQGITSSLSKLRMAITPYYLSLIDPSDPEDPIRKQSIPTIDELNVGAGELQDPLSEDKHSPVPGLTHRYPDRGILLVTDQCSMYCRHCTRRRKAGENDSSYSKDQIKNCIEYMKKTPTLRDIIVTGGDSLLLSDEMLDWILGELRSIPHLETIRVATRTPVVLPQRITDNLCKILRKHHPVWINTHFNHPFEVTEEATAACAKLADAGIPLGNQTVLLRGINDNPYVIRELCHRLTRIRVRPYYLFQCDLSQGIEHFRTPIAKGVEILEYLRGHTSGFAIPTFAVDLPSGGGKIMPSPNYILAQSDRRVVCRNYEGVITTYTEPEDRTSKLSKRNNKIIEHQKSISQEGLIPLLEGTKFTIEPAHLSRNRRKNIEESAL